MTCEAKLIRELIAFHTKHNFPTAKKIMQKVLVEHIKTCKQCTGTT